MLDRPNDSLSARDIAYHMHPFTNARRLESEGPFVITRGSGIHIYDEQGRDYIDAMAGLWCASLGFSEKRLAEAAYKQMLELPYASTFGQRSHPTVIALAEKLISLMPVRMSKVFFNNSGSEANDSAAKLVWYYNNAIGRPRKKKIIGRMKGYHGITVASGSLCGLPYVHKDFDLPIPNVRHTDCPHYWRYGKPGESEEDFASRMAENLDALIEREGPGHGRRVHRRTGAGCRRRGDPAAHVFRQDPGGAAQARRAVHRRRGDLRLRAHRQHVRLRDLRHRA